MVVPGRRSRPNQRVSPPPSSAPEKTDDVSVLSQGATAAPSEPSDISPAVPVETIYKLLAFTFAMICGPLGAYFLSIKTFFSGNSTLAGGLAALTANVVLIAYVIVAWQEDKEDQAKRKEKKGQ
ncbi:vacuolar ATPase assembly integral membrane protein vma21 [Talaromyces marneffei ATCC 18224]|uniref:Uncharacterized protein n=2 Tax=Talaromyces marneffei TaxID=37727 RepID=B6QVP9_TALMQ|nr:uncharacterized protein EYB26_009805 [Talaromyces marneffei]EEA19054.1 conserved hypothetical protein [Talaromyces marneffei ATCC 18224]KAE8548748.1 hypothetical protein EYB25_009129 [Talaromyces marneffei]QGA22091.1 hypothetical protein EYB26_009805 [Talaromyces marneffei]